MKLENLLKQAKYTLVLPRTGIKPMDLIVQDKQNVFQRVFKKTTEGELMNSSIKDVFKMKGRGVSLPKIKPNKLPKNLVAADILDAEAKFVIDLKKIANAGAELTVVKKVLFSFENTASLTANQVNIDEYINYADVDQRLDIYDQLKAGNIYVITEVLQSANLSLTNANEFQVKGKIETTDILDYVSELDVSGKIESSDHYKISNDTGEPLVFALKALRILFVNNKYRLTRSTIVVRGNEIKGVESINEDFIEL
ncbi:MAG: hypothetical protein AB8G11_00075 [Saprospiraceae bacterium]